MPPEASIAAIEVCSGRHSCSEGKYKIEDTRSIALAIEQLKPFQKGWKTETQMALTTGWFTYPTPQDTILIRGNDGKTSLVVWFGPGWMGADVYAGSGKGRYFRSEGAEDVKLLRNALRLTDCSTERQTTSRPAAC